MTTIVLIPGAGGDSYYWHLVVPRLAERGWNVIAPDLPADDDSAGIPEYADAVMEAVGDRRDIVVVAQSLGAFTAVALAERMPVSLIVFVAAMIPSPGETSGEWWEATGQAAAKRELDRREGRDPDAPFDVMATFLHDVPAEIVDRLFERGDRPQSGRPFESANTATAWRAIPLGVIAGSQDRFFPIEFMRRLSRERAGVEPVAIDAGHLLALSKPEELAGAIAAFVSRPGQRPPDEEAALTATAPGSRTVGMASRGAEWVADYVSAWESNDPSEIGALFTDDAVYLTSPDSEPRRGRDEIVAGWLEDLDEPGTWSFDWEIIHETPELVLVQGRTDYPSEKIYLNLWVIRLDEHGRATSFTEWYMPREH